MITVPTFEQLVELRETGRKVGYNGIYIYLRYKAILSVLRGRTVKNVLNVGCGFGIFDRLLVLRLSVGRADGQEDVGGEGARDEGTEPAEGAHQIHGSTSR